VTWQWLAALLLALSGSFTCVAQTSADGQWRDLDPANTVYLDLPDGRVVIELNPDFAPKHVEQFKQLVRKGFYDGLSFYRVIDGFVAQGGDESDIQEEGSEQRNLPAEFERAWSDDLKFVSAQKPDLFAPETGFIEGFPAARDSTSGRVWLTHCPGVVAMVRNNEPGSGATDFYIVIGQAPRYLDRNLSVFGRVVSGMDKVQRINRGPTDKNGIIEDQAQRSRMLKLEVAADLPGEKRLPIQIIDTNSSEFQQTLDSRRKREHEFFHHTPPAVLDVCQVPLATQAL
jgi:peptidylprolyl isomerase